MKTKFINNILLIMIILGTLTLASFGLFLLTKDSAYATDVYAQSDATNNANVTFDAGFQDSSGSLSHSTVADVNPEFKNLRLQIGLVSGCTLINPQVQFLDSSNGTDINFDLGSGFGNLSGQYINSSSATTNTIVLNNLTNGLIYDFPMSIDLGNTVDISKLNDTSKVIFTATCQDASGNTSNVYKEVSLNIGWTANLTMDLAQHVKTYTRNSNSTLTIETILSNKINSSGKYNILPVKQTVLVVDVPTYQGISPSSVNVIAEKTIATNGKDESNVVFDTSNWTYNSSTGKITITVDNPVNSGSVASVRGTDNYIITYTYPQAAYDAFTSSASIINKVSGTMTLYSNTSTIDITNSINDTFSLTGEFGSSSSNKIPKLGFYFNAIGSPAYPDYSLDFGYIVTLIAEEVGSTAAYRLEFESLKFKTSTSEYDGFDSSTNTNHAPITNFSIPVDSFNEFLGSSGSVKIYDQDYTLIGTITSSTAVNSENQYEFQIPTTYQNSSQKFILETTTPIQNLAQLAIYSTRKMGPTFPFTLQQWQQIKSSYSKVNLYSSLTSSPTTFEQNIDKTLTTEEKDFLDTSTNANLNIETSTLDASNPEFQELKLKIVLDNMNDNSDVWSTPYFDIELPAYITEIDRDIAYSVNHSPANDISFDTEAGAKVTLIDNKLHLTFACKGQQQYVFTTPTTITLTLKVKVNKYASNISQDAKLYYINNYAYTYDSPSTWALTPSTTGNSVGFPIFANGTIAGLSTAEVNFVTSPTLLCVSELTGYNTANDTINSLDNADTTATISRTTSTTPTMNLIVQNNHTVPVSGVSILGRIPYTGNKYAISNTDLGTNINTQLASLLTQTTNNIPSSNITIYYSDNLNATKDLSLSSNNWVTSPGNLSTIKSYLIVINDTLDVGEQVKFAYNFSVPAGLDYNKTLFANFGANYTANGTSTSSESDKIGLTTGAGPVLRVEKTSSIANGATVKEGDIITYTITVYNDGSIAANNVVINDNIPTNTTYVVQNDTGYTTVPTQTQISQNAGTINPGDNYSFSFSVVVNEINSNSTISNVATATADGVPAVPSNTLNISSVTSAPNLTIEKTSSIPDGSIVREGDEITYTIVVRNDGDGIARNVIIHDVIPKNTTYYDEETGTLDPEKVRIDSDPKDILPPGETYEISFTVVVDPINEDTVIQNAATVTADNSPEKTSNTVNINASTSDPLLRVEKKSSITNGAVVKEGDLITYTITVFNDGYGPANNIVIRDTVPEGTIYYNTETNTKHPEITTVNSNPKDVLNPGDNYQFTFTVIVDRISSGTIIQNTAKVTGDNVPETSSNTVGITADPTVPNLRVEKTSSIPQGSTVKEGDIITYTITVYNDGTTPAYNIMICDTVPQYTTFYEDNTRKPDKVNLGYPVSVLNPGDDCSYSFSVIVEEIPENVTIQNTAIVTAENSPEIPSNTVGINAKISVPTLRLEKTSSITEGTTVKEGDIITYTITVYNEGDCIAHDVVISDIIPTNTIYVEKVGSEYISNPGQTTVSKLIETLEPGQSESLTFSVIVDKLSSNTTISNTAKVNANNSPEISSNTVGISAKPKDDPSTGDLPYAGHYSTIFILAIAIIGLTGFVIYQYKKLKRD